MRDDEFKQLCRITSEDELNCLYTDRSKKMTTEKFVFLMEA